MALLVAGPRADGLIRVRAIFQRGLDESRRPAYNTIDFYFVEVPDDVVEKFGGVNGIYDKFVNAITGADEGNEPSIAERVDILTNSFRNLFENIEVGWERLNLWRENNSVVVELDNDATISWADVLRNGWIVPWVAHCVNLVKAAVDNPTDETLTAAEKAVTADVDSLKYEFETLGISLWYSSADRTKNSWASVANLGGNIVYATNAETGGFGTLVNASVDYGDYDVATYPCRDKVIEVIGV